MEDHQQQSGLPTMCCAMQMETEMQKLEQLYAVYEVHAKNVDSFSMVLWADLDVAKIIEVTEEVAVELKKKRFLSDMPLFDAVSKSIQGFLSSLPLMKELKSEALRKRHWNNLMTVCTDVPCSSINLCSLDISMLNWIDRHLHISSVV